LARSWRGGGQLAGGFAAGRAVVRTARCRGVRAIEPALGATLGASMGFMMPVSTPTNAIVYSSGYIPITAMMRYGVMLDVMAFFVINAIVLFLAPIVFP